MANYFTDRVVQYPGRVVMNPVSGEANTYDMSRAEGSVAEEGTPFNADTFNAIVEQILLAAHPIGSIYISTNNVNPGTFLGGTWERIKDTFLLAGGDTYSPGATGGEATHKLTAAESGVPAHGHGMAHTHSHNHQAVGYVDSRTAAGSDRRTVVPYNQSGTTGVFSTDTDSTSSSKSTTDNNTAAPAAQAHNNMPPYLAVYVWKRTA